MRNNESGHDLLLDIPTPAYLNCKNQLKSEIA